jgi:hypothetical protein
MLFYDQFFKMNQQQDGIEVIASLWICWWIIIKFESYNLFLCEFFWAFFIIVYFN